MYYGPIDRQLVAAVLARDNYRCIYCNQASDRVCFVVPKCYGGLAIVNNAVVICRYCRTNKGYGLNLDYITKGLQHIIRFGGSIDWVDKV